MASKERVTIAIDGDLVKRIDMIASAKRQSRSAWFEQAARDAMDQEEAAVKFFSDPLLSGAFLKAFSQPGMLKNFAEVIGSDLEPDQLKLFEQRISGLVREPGLLKNKKLVKKGKR